MSLKTAENIFDSPAQHIRVDPASIRLISDRVLIRDLGEQEYAGLLAIPETAKGKDSIRVGVVVAVGPGDRFIECGLTEEHQVRRKLITGGKCPHCLDGKQFDLILYEVVDCEACYGGGKEPLCIPPQCQPGDRVLYSRRREAEVFIEGVRYVLCHAEQSVLAVLED